MTQTNDSEQFDLSIDDIKTDTFSIINSKEYKSIQQTEASLSLKFANHCLKKSVDFWNKQ